MLPVVWIPDAREDLLEAIAWYDNVRAGLGKRFALAVEATIEAITENRLQFPAVHHDDRHARVQRFPYGISCELREEQIVAIACFHGRRNPRRWQVRQPAHIFFQLVHVKGPTWSTVEDGLLPKSKSKAVPPVRMIPWIAEWRASHLADSTASSIKSSDILRRVE